MKNKLSKYITSQCSKLTASLSSNQNGKLILLFSIPVLLVEKFKHHKESRLSYIAC